MKQFRSLLLFGTLVLLNGMPARSQSLPPANRPVLRIQSQGADVSNVQAALKLLGYYTDNVDGIYGESTVIAVYRFQQAARLNPTGIVDSATWAALFPATAVRPPTPTSTSETPILKLGTTGPAVTLLQQRLNALGFPIAIDRVFGPQTHQAVVAAQKKYNITPDGIVGPATWRILLRR